MFREFLNNFYKMFFRYRGALAHFSEKKSIWHGLVIYLVVKFLFYFSIVNFNTQDLRSTIACPLELEHFFTENLFLDYLQIVPLSTVFLHLSFGPLFFFAMVAIVHFVAILFGGQSRVSSLGAVFGYAYLPYLFVAASTLLAHYTGFNLVGPLLIVAFIWSLWLKIEGLRLVHSFSLGRAALVFFMPVLAFMLSFLIFLLFAIVFLIPVILQIMEGLSLSFSLA